MSRVKAPCSRLVLAALLAGLVSACATPAVLERARDKTETETRDTTISSVKRAGRDEDGMLLLCLELRGFKKEQATIEIPVQALGEPRKRTGFDFGRQKGFDGPTPDDPSVLRYVFVQDDLE